MAKRCIKAGSTDQTIDVFVLDSSSTTGAGLAGLAYNTAGLTCYYRKGATGTPTALTLATQTVGGAHSDGGFVAVDGTNCPGQYRLDLSDTIVATAGMVTLYLKGATNMAPVTVELEIVAYDPFDAVRLGLTALPNAAADAAGGLVISDAGGLDIDNRTPAAASVTNMNTVFNTDFATNYNTTIDRWCVNITAVNDATGNPIDGLQALGDDYANTAGVLPVNVTQISSDSIAADNLELAFDDTAGAVPWMGILDQGTAQSATGTTLVLRSASAFADNVLIGSVVMVYGSTQGYWQVREITDYDLATDTITVDTWTTTPSGTITYKIFAGPPALSTLPAVNVTQLGGDSQSLTDLKDFADAGYDPATNKVQGLVLADAVTTVNGLAANVVTAASTAADFITEIQTACGNALTSYDPPTKAELDTAESNIRGVDSDTLKTLSDQIDGLSTSAAPQLLQNTTIATLASQTSFTLTAGSADNDVYNGAVIVVTDQSTSTQKAVGLVSDYVGSTKTITLSADPGIFTMAVGDTVDILANITSAPTVTQIRQEIDSNSTQLAAIVSDTNELQTDWANGGRLDLLIDSILADTGTDGVAISAATANQIADALLDRTAGVETNRTPRQTLRLVLAALVGKLSGAATTTVTIRDTNDTADRITATVDADGNRSAVTLNAG